MHAANLNISLDDFLHDSQRFDVVLSGRDFYVAFRDRISYILAVFLLVLVLPLVWFFVYYFRRRLQKRIPNGIHITFDNYAQMRQASDKLNITRDRLQEIQKTNIRNAPFLLRGFLREIKRSAGILCQAADSIKAALKANNDDFPKSNLNVFQPISDDTLWSNRPKIYQYRL